MSLILPRRSVLLGIAAILASPAVVRAESLMRISGEEPYIVAEFPYHYRGADLRVGFAVEQQTIRRSEFEIAAPKRRAAGEYFWSNLETGGPDGQIVRTSGLISRMTPRLHVFQGPTGGTFRAI